MISTTADLAFPICLNDGDRPVWFDPEKAPLWYLDNEQGDTGWYPIGRGRTWHLGIHLWAGTVGRRPDRYADTDWWQTPTNRVFAIAPGRIVAARLTCPLEERERAFGSRGFVLLRHEVFLPGRRDPFPFYSLYHGIAWPEEIRSAVPWLRRLPAPGSADGVDRESGSNREGRPERELVRLRRDMTLYRHEHDTAPSAYLKKNTILERSPSRPLDKGGWQRVRLHRGQCPLPQRREHPRAVVTGWLWTVAPRRDLQPLRMSGRRAVTGVDGLRMRRTPGRGPEPTVVSLGDAGTEVETLSATATCREGHRWQAVRVRVRQTRSSQTARPQAFEVTTGDGNPGRGRWAYGWVYDGDRLVSAASLQRISTQGETARRLHAGAITTLGDEEDIRVRGGDWLGAFGPMEADPRGPRGAGCGIHVEVFTAEDPTAALEMPCDRDAQERDWIVATDDTDDHVFCTSDQIRLTAAEDPDLLQMWYDRAVAVLGGEDWPASRHPRHVEAYRDVAVRTTSPWAMDWTRAAEANPTWASALALTDEDIAEMQEHAWWDQLPADVLPPRTNGRAAVWHVHPLRWLEALHSALPGEGIAPYLLDERVRLRRKAKAGYQTEGEHVEALQRDLRRLGFDVGRVDGTYGAATQGAVVCLQVETYYHVVDGRLDPSEAFGQTSEAWIDGWAIDGILGPGTKAALRAWLDTDLRAAYPREINVATEHPGAPMGYIQLDRAYTNGGVYHYQGGETGDQPARDEIEWWGMPPIVYTLERVARTWATRGHPRIQIGDMTRPQGGTYWRLTNEEYVDDGREDVVRGEYVEATSPKQFQKTGPDGTSYRIDHGTHNRGWVADIRPMVGSEEDVGQGLTVDSDAYDRKLSYAFLTLLKTEAPRNRGSSMTSLVLFGDQKMSDPEAKYYVPIMRYDENHADHYHLISIVGLEDES